MPSQSVEAAVAAKLAAEFSLCPVFGPNQQAQPPADGSDYVLVQYPFADERQHSIGAPGSNVFREEGAIRFVIHTARDAGTVRTHQIATALRNLFRNARMASLNCFAPTAPVFDDRNDEGGYFVASLAVPYEFDIHA